MGSPCTSYVLQVWCADDEVDVKSDRRRVKIQQVLHRRLLLLLVKSSEDRRDDRLKCCLSPAPIPAWVLECDFEIPALCH